MTPFVGDPEGAYSVQIAHILNLGPEIRASLLPELLPDQAAAGGRQGSALSFMVAHTAPRKRRPDCLMVS